jgi:DNA replication protein DnaC
MKPNTQLEQPKANDSKMMMNTTLNQLRSLRLETMAQALEQQLQQSGISAMSFEERLALLVDREVHGRQDRRCARLLKTARLKYPQAAIEDLDSRSTRGLERSAVMSLALGEWVKAGHAVLITGATGAGKSWLACALAQHACRRGHSALYLRVPRLGEELRIRHANGTFTRWLDTLKNTDVLLLDDWGMAAMDSQTRADLLEIIDDRANQRATIITSQLPIEHWHEWIGDQTVADAMLDRLMQNHHRFTLTGESLRKKATHTKAKAD